MKLRGALALALVLSGALPLAAQETTREQDLEAIRGEIARLQADVGRLRARQSGIAGELERTEIEVRLQEQRVAEATAAQAVASERAAAIATQVQQLEAQLQALRDALRRSLEGLYRLGRHGYLRLFLSLEPKSSMLPGIRLLRLIARRDDDALDRFRATRTQLEFEQEQLVEQRRELDAWVVREEQQQAKLVTLRRRQAAMLAEVKSRGASLAQREGDLRDRERKLSSLLDVLAGRNREPLEGRSIQEFRGVLDWPVRGEVTQPFGRHQDARYGTAVPHNGLDIAVAADAPVRAVYPGKVIFAAPFEGFGQAVVVQHPGKALTLYAGLARLEVAKDDVVALQGRLGTAAAGTLYFEIRFENRPEDPALWLR
jgi:murein hydrolase activator